jgi:uncharacterized repeat protein (TIGR03943 family)
MVLSALAAAFFLAMGVYMVALVFSGNVVNYVNGRFAWLSLLAGTGFLVLAAHALAQLRSAPAAAVHGDHVHGPTSPLALALLTLPLLLGVMVPSQPLGASAVSGDLTANAGIGEPAAPPPEQGVRWTVVDWLRAFYYSERPERLNGRDADVIGFVYRKPGDPVGHFRVARFLMSCCSADSVAVGLPVAWDGADALAVDTWVRVQGTLQVRTFGGDTLPVIQASGVDDTVGRPSQPYLYP